jgi:phosphopantothenoylcysteine decarboxylase/phosphopantothenate--cysteine ligase
MEEGRAKIAAIEEIVLHTERALLGSSLAGKTVLVTSGPCREEVDDVRVLTTRSSGAMGREVALQAFRLGADVSVVHADVFPCIKNIFAGTAQQMREQVLDQMSRSSFDYYVSAAAISDFAPVRHPTKIESGTAVQISLIPLPKLLDEVLARTTATTVAFKLGGKSGEKAQQMLVAGAAMVVVNPPEVMGGPGGEFIFITSTQQRHVSGTKEEVAAALWAALL